LLLTIRSLFFYIGYIALTIWFGVTGIMLFGWQPYAIRRRYILLWNRLAIFWLKFTCGVRYQVEGLENIPEGPFVVLSNHQSQWETFYLQLLFQPLATIMKRELLNIPGFGWGLRLLKPIAINRGKPRDAMKQMLAKGRHRIEEGISVLVFPEGTRAPNNQIKKYARGGAALAVESNAPLVMVAHNAGSHWPPHQFIKYPGTIQVRIAEIVDRKDKTSRELTELAQCWIQAQLKEMSSRDL